MSKIQEAYATWLEKAVLDADLIPELKAMSDDKKQDAFYRDLAFGTGGLRGKIGAGTNRMNVYTVGKATQGIVNYLKKSQKDGLKVAISYDSRIKSRTFAEFTARVFAANGIEVHIYPTLMPVPCCSFATRYYKCNVGVMITASHNPSVYNGYKVYGPDGCQITTEGADAILNEIEKLDPFNDVASISFEEGKAKGLIQDITPDCYDAYVKEVKSQSLLGDAKVNKGANIIYSPLHGSGLKPVTRVLSEMGFNNIRIVKEQEEPDGNFTTCPYPNPEIKEAMAIGMEYAKKYSADLLLATDPDCDRVGIAIKDKQGEYRLMTGNETGLLLFNYIIERRKALNKMPSDPVLIKTIVSTDLADKIASSNGIKTINVLTGFKFIGEQIAKLEANGKASSYIFGFEESYGCLVGTYVRDKDAVVASMMIVEMYSYYTSLGKSLLDVLEGIYETYGYRRNSLASYEFEGESGFYKMQSIMKGMRDNSPSSFAGVKVDTCNDYNKGIDGLPKSDVLKYFLEDGTTLVLRPSGTEPKLKAYFSIPAKDETEAKAKEASFKADIEKKMA